MLGQPSAEVDEKCRGCGAQLRLRVDERELGEVVAAQDRYLRGTWAGREQGRAGVETTAGETGVEVSA